MRLPDGTILMHGKQPYDALKAHQYYLRTRHLKGRKKSDSYTIITSDGKTVQISAEKLLRKNESIE
jgi:hypothetical protein